MIIDNFYLNLVTHFFCIQYFYFYENIFAQTAIYNNPCLFMHNIIKPYSI